MEVDFGEKLHRREAKKQNRPESSFEQVLDAAQFSAAQRRRFRRHRRKSVPDRRIRAAWHISFSRPKNSIRNSQAGLLTQHQRPARSSQLSPMTSCARLRFTAAVLSEILTPFPFHPRDARGHLRTPMYSVFRSHYNTDFHLCKYLYIEASQRSRV